MPAKKENRMRKEFEENVSAEIAYALKQGIEAAGGKVRIISSTQEANEKRKVRETVIEKIMF